MSPPRPEAVSPETRSRILRKIREWGRKGMSRSWLISDFYREGTPTAIDAALSEMVASGLIRERRVPVRRGRSFEHRAIVFVADRRRAVPS